MAVSKETLDPNQGLLQWFPWLNMFYCAGFSGPEFGEKPLISSVIS